MQCTLSLSGIYGSESDKIGYRAVDIALVHRSKMPVPLSFVIPNHVFEDFVSQSKLLVKLNRISDAAFPIQDVEKEYSEVKSLFSETEFSTEVVECLREAYEALSVSGSAALARDLLEEKEPVVNVLVSPDYLLPDDFVSGVLINIKGFQEFLDAVKSAWLSLFTPKSILWRRKLGVKDFVIGLVVQRFVDSDAVVEASSKSIIGDYEIEVKSYLGLLDVTNSLHKDEHAVAKEFLKVTSGRIGNQEFIIKRGVNSGTLIKKKLGNRASEQKLTEKQVAEAARLTKRISQDLGMHVKGYFFFKDEQPGVLFVERVEAVQNEAEDEGALSARLQVNKPAEQEYVADQESQDDALYSDNESSESFEGSDADFDLLAGTKSPQEEIEEMPGGSVHEPEEVPFDEPAKDLPEAPVKEEPEEEEGGVFGYVRALAGLEPDLDAAINKLYSESYGIDPQDYMAAINDLEGLSAEEKQDLLFLKTLKRRANAGETLTIGDLTRVYDTVEKVIDRARDPDEA